MMLKNTNYHPKAVGDRDERWEMYLREYNTTDGSNFKQGIKKEKREAQSQIQVFKLQTSTPEISKYGVEWRWGVSAYTLFNWLLGSIVGKWQSIQEIKYGISHLKVEETQACLAALLGR